MPPRTLFEEGVADNIVITSEKDGQITEEFLDTEVKIITLIGSMVNRSDPLNSLYHFQLFMSVGGDSPYEGPSLCLEPSPNYSAQLHTIQVLMAKYLNHGYSYYADGAYCTQPLQVHVNGGQTIRDLLKMMIHKRVHIFA